MATTTEAKVLLDRRFKEREQTEEYARQLLDMLEKAQAASELEKMINIATTVKEKTDKARQELTRVSQRLEQHEQQLQDDISEHYHTALPDDPVESEPSIEKVKQCLQEERLQLSRAREDLTAKRRVQYAKKHVKMQKRALPVQFDPSSDDSRVQGYFKKSDGTLETFSFDLTEKTSKEISDYLWTHCSP